MSVMPAPRRIALHALIEEARRRARQRRLAYAAAIAVAAGAIGVGLALSGASATPKAPSGFTVVKARGQVAHALIRLSSSARITSLSGQDRPAKMVEEVWYDARGGFWRDVLRIDGRVRSDRAGTCPVSPKAPPCGSAGSLSYLRPFPSTTGLRVTGAGTFRGVPVVWLEPKAGLTKHPSPAFPQLGLDARTHRLVVERYLSRNGRLVDETTVTQKPTLPAGSFSFVVRKNAPRGFPNPSLEPRAGDLLAYGLPAARRALGTTPLWLGPRFRGLVPISVQARMYPVGVTKTGALRPASFVRLYYGRPADGIARLAVDEFGSTRPFFYREGPRPGQIERDVQLGSVARLTKDGLLLRVFMAPLKPANAIALAKALRPLPPGVKSLPSPFPQ